jgi:hypothetical protein
MLVSEEGDLDRDRARELAGKIWDDPDSEAVQARMADFLATP